MTKQTGGTGSGVWHVAYGLRPRPSTSSTLTSFLSHRLRLLQWVRASHQITLLFLYSFPHRLPGWLLLWRTQILDVDASLFRTVLDPSLVVEVLQEHLRQMLIGENA